MNLFTQLKLLVSVQLLTFILVIIAIVYPVESLLDPLLQEYLNKTYLEDENIFLLSFLPIFFVYLTALITLLFKKYWAKKAYVYISIIMLPITFFLGANVDHAITAGLNEIMMFSNGMLVALLMYTNVYEEE